MHHQNSLELFFLIEDKDNILNYPDQVFMYDVIRTHKFLSKISNNIRVLLSCHFEFDSELLQYLSSNMSLPLEKKPTPSILFFLCPRSFDKNISTSKGGIFAR